MNGWPTPGTRGDAWPAELRISEADVLGVLNGPDLTYQSYGRRVAETVFGGRRLLRIVFVDTPLAETDARIISTIDLQRG